MRIDDRITIPESEIELKAIRAQGAGGQNVNKVASAIHLRFDIRASSLPEPVKQRLLQAADGRVTQAGVLVIKAQSFRTQERNRAAALGRLRDLVREAVAPPRPRIPTRPGKAQKKQRLESKRRRSKLKRLRGKPAPDAD